MALQSVGSRRIWIIIHGYACPEGDKTNAEKIAAYLRSKLNFVRVLPSDARTLSLLTRFCNFVVIGGPVANEWAFNLNGYVQPRYKIEVTREREPGESWGDYVKSGAFTVSGFLKNDVFYPGAAGVGSLGKGSQPYPRVRPLQIIVIGGWDYGDSCTIGKAFRNDAGPGIYSCVYPPLTFEDPYPPDESMSYTLITDP
jgi:hypothetical protein